MAIWPFGRRRDADEPAPEPAAADSASPVSGEADVARPERTPTGDWMTLAPVRTAMAQPMPTTFRVQRLPEILTSHQDSRVSGSLGHAVSADAPSGTIAGLAETAGAVRYEGAQPAAELREPRHAASPPADLVAPVQRRLADPAPLAVSGGAPLTTTTPPAPALPEPAVSRVLASRGALPPAAPDTPPLPVARVVDAAPSASNASSSSSGPTPAADPGPSSPDATSTSSAGETGLIGDDRVGGFEVDLGSLLGGPDVPDDLPVLTPPPDLAPPIQRTVRRDAPPTLRAPIQRVADGPAASAPSSASEPSITSATPTAAPEAGGGSDATAPTSPSSPTVAEQPPIQRLGAPDAPAAAPSAPGAGASPAASPSGSTAGDGAGDAVADRPLAGSTATGAGGDAASSLLTTSAAASTAGDGPGALPLAAPAVQRLAEGTAAGPTAGATPSITPSSSEPSAPASTASTPAAPVTSIAAPEGDADSATGVAPTATPETGATEAPAGATPAVQRSADEHVPGDGHDHGDDDVQRVADGSSTAPLTGANPLAPAAGLDLVDAAETNDDGTGASGDLPLVSRLAEPTAPTLGTSGLGPGARPLQTLSDDVTPMPGAGTSALPLAPAEGAGSLIPPASPGSSGPAALASAGLVGDRPATTPSLGAPTTLGGGSSGAGAGSVTTQRATSSVGSGGLPFAVQRLASGGGSATGAATATPALAPLASIGGLARSASSTSSGAGTTADAASGSPMTVLGAPPVEAPAVPLQRSFDAPLVAPASFGTSTSPATTGGGSVEAVRATSTGGSSTDGGTPTTVARLPLASPTAPSPSGSVTPLTELPTQRAVDGGGASSPAASSMPLHTAAANVPSTTDILVKAGLGERAPDGSFLRNTPPPGEPATFTVQTMPDVTGGSWSSSPSSPATVQREVVVDQVSTSVAGSGGSDGGTGGAGGEDVRKLYRKIRAELEADLRRQLEAKSRYNRYRP